MQALTKNKWSLEWTLSGSKCLVSAKPVWRGKVTGCPSNLVLWGFPSLFTLWSSASGLSFLASLLPQRWYSDGIPRGPGSCWADYPLELIHSDVCGKIGTRSLGGGEYIVTFVDDHTRHVWVYILKHKNEVFGRFRERKALVERSSGRNIKTLPSDNGGEYTSTELTTYLTKEGIKHELTTPHTPELNGEAELYTDRGCAYHSGRFQQILG